MEMLTTIEAVKTTEPLAASFPDETVQQMIKDASYEVSFLSLTDEQKEVITRYKVCHMIVLRSRSGAVKEKIDVLERTFSNNGNSTYWSGLIDDLLNKWQRKGLNLTILN